MNRNDRNEMLKDFEEIYKPAMRRLYMKWKMYSDSEVSEMFYYWIAKHRHEKVMDLINKRKHRRLKTAKLKTELDMLKAKQRNENYLEELK